MPRFKSLVSEESVDHHDHYNLSYYQCTFSPVRVIMEHDALLLRSTGGLRHW